MAITFVNSEGIFKILSLPESQVNFQQNSYNTSHHTFSVLARYLAKVRSYWHIWKKMQTKT